MDVSVFDPLDNYAELDMTFWPAVEDQIELVGRRQAQVARVLSFYKGNERDYKDLKRESDILYAAHRTLCAVRELCNNNRVHADASTRKDFI